MSPFGSEMQNDVPSTRVIVPAPTGPAAVSAFHPAIPGPFKKPTPARPNLVARPPPSPCLSPTLLLLAPAGQSSAVGCSEGPERIRQPGNAELRPLRRLRCKAQPQSV